MWTAFARTHYERANTRYASDVTDDEYGLIEPLLPSAKRGGRPRTTDLREVLNAILYLIRTGCPWDMLPKAVSTKRHSLRLLSTFLARRHLASDLDDPVDAGARASRQGGVIDRGVVDSQSVKTTESGGLRGYDAGKKINGRKRHLVTDTIGLPLNLAVHAANIQDRDGLALACRWVKRRFPWLLCLFADAGYQGPVAAANAKGAGLKLEIVKRAPHAEGFEIIPRRWVIERTFGWLGRNRRLAKDFQRLIETSTAMVVVAIIQLLVRRLANG